MRLPIVISKGVKTLYEQMFFYSCVSWHTPNSFRDSNVNPKLKTTEEQRVGAIPWLVALRRVEGRVGASGLD